jgi:hypothetical protein
VDTVKNLLVAAVVLLILFVFLTGTPMGQDFLNSAIAWLRSLDFFRT